MIQRRQAVCSDREIGLTKLYNEVDDGAYADLRRLHEQLDLTVAAAYGWPASAATTSADRCHFAGAGGRSPSRSFSRSTRAADSSTRARNFSERFASPSSRLKTGM